MRNLIVGAATISFAFFPLPASASVSRQQLIEYCRPQIETLIQESLSEPARTPEDKAQIAGLRVNGINDPLIGEIVDSLTFGAADADVPALRQDLDKLRSGMAGVTEAQGRGSEIAAGIVALCLGDAILADKEGRAIAMPRSAGPAFTAPQPSHAVASDDTRTDDVATDTDQLPEDRSKASPLGLRGAPAPAQTGALAPDPERYWVKGRVILTDCDRNCPPVSLRTNV